MGIQKVVGVIYGGNSGEHEVSCRSARLVYEMLEKVYKVILIGINKKGFWFWQTETSIQDSFIKIQEERLVYLIPGQGIAFNNERIHLDCVFPIIHGDFGEDGHLQSILECLGIPYVGCSSFSSALCMDKILLKTALIRAGLPTLPFESLSKKDFLDQNGNWQKKIDILGGYPVIVKPSTGGSSLGVSKVENFEKLNEAFLKAFQWSHYILVEPFEKSREIECAITQKQGELIVHPLGEVSYSQSEIYDYETKYENKGSLELIVPAHIPEILSQRIKETAKQAYGIGRCSGMARIDFFISLSNPQNIYINEINTIPGFTKVSLFPQMCLASGISLSDLGNILIEEAITNLQKR